MPFTLSHAAAVLPIHRLSPRLPLAALMIGSLSPDFLYFMPFRADWVESHSVPGLFYFCWPLGLLVWVVFVRVLEWPTQVLLPEAWRGVFPIGDGRVSVHILALVSLALLLGAMTHIVWDSFTHRSQFSETLPLLSTPVFEIHGRARRVWWVLQQVSTVLGLAVLLVWALRRRAAPRDPRAAELPALPHSSRVVAIGFIVVCSLLGAMFDRYTHPDAHFERGLFHLAIGGMAGAAFAWIVVSLWIRWKIAPLRE